MFANPILIPMTSSLSRELKGIYVSKQAGNILYGEDVPGRFAHLNDVLEDNAWLLSLFLLSPRGGTPSNDYQCPPGGAACRIICMLTCVQHPDDAIIRYVNEPDQFETPNCYFGYGLKGKVPFMGLVSAVSFNRWASLPMPVPIPCPCPCPC